MKLIDADKLLRFFTVDTANQTYRFGTIKKQIENAETVQAIPILDNATNGDMIKTMFGIADNDIDEGLSTTYVYTKTRVLKGGSQDYLREQITFNREWWNAPYKRGNENGSN